MTTGRPPSPTKTEADKHWVNVVARVLVLAVVVGVTTFELDVVIFVVVIPAPIERPTTDGALTPTPAEIEDDATPTPTLKRLVEFVLIEEEADITDVLVLATAVLELTPSPIECETTGVVNVEEMVGPESEAKVADIEKPEELEALPSPTEMLTTGLCANLEVEVDGNDVEACPTLIEIPMTGDDCVVVVEEVWVTGLLVMLEEVDLDPATTTDILPPTLRVEDSPTPTEPPTLRVGLLPSTPMLKHTVPVQESIDFVSLADVVVSGEAFVVIAEPSPFETEEVVIVMIMVGKFAVDVLEELDKMTEPIEPLEFAAAAVLDVSLGFDVVVVTNMVEELLAAPVSVDECSKDAEAVVPDSVLNEALPPFDPFVDELVDPVFWVVEESSILRDIIAESVKLGDVVVVHMNKL